MPLEIACFHEEAIKIAIEAGADRLELCYDYSSGGLTPPESSLLKCLQETTLPIHVMLRNRPGNFVYSNKEKDQLLDTLRMLITFPVAGIVTGALRDDQSIDVTFMEKVKNLLTHQSIVFHRAFDLSSNWKKNMDVLIELKIDGVLTSGGSDNAINNIETLKAMQDYAGRSIELICGGGIRAANIQQIASFTGIQWMHSAAITSNHALLPDSKEITQLKSVLSAN